MNITHAQDFTQANQLCMNKILESNFQSKPHLLYSFQKYTYVLPVLKVHYYLVLWVIRLEVIILVATSHTGGEGIVVSSKGNYMIIII